MGIFFVHICLLSSLYCQLIDFLIILFVYYALCHGCYSIFLIILFVYYALCPDCYSIFLIILVYYPHFMVFVHGCLFNLFLDHTFPKSFFTFFCSKTICTVYVRILDTNLVSSIFGLCPGLHRI